MPTILCLDPGAAHTGIAISYEGILAEPLATIFEKNTDKLIGKLIPIIAKNNPDTIIIGSPQSGPLITVGEILKDELEKFFSGDIVLFSEDLSSKMARSKMKEAHKTLAKRKKEEHQTAAALILQDYLENNF